ncbi:MAG: hypothetical protein NC253_15915 [Ruminococcus sp.]|nr:hypothetical protein [Ruminococcus sp.]MCM1382108.1 hypothetical protein [Muribaculaceae bacterium]MCM1478533.1 hypothetical protein [Muribaculaceae bacterium]
MSGILKITAVNLRHNFPLHLGIAVAVAVFTPLIFSISALDFATAARPLEMLLCMAGAALLTPVFLPEQDEGVRDVIRSKKTDYLAVCFIRVLYSVIALAAVVGAFTLVMRFCECEVTAVHFGAGFASGFFLGAVGLCFAKFGGSPTIGYMAAMIYYAANYGVKDKLGDFFLFTVSGGERSVNFTLLIGGAVIILGTFAVSKIIEKIK